MSTKPFILLVLLLTTCKSAMTIQDLPPAPILNAYFYEYVSGQSASGRGYELVIQLDNPAIILDSVRFKDQNQAMSLSAKGFVARFNQNGTADMIMSADPIDEYGNEMPKMNQPEFPRKTDLNCVVRFSYLNKIGYFKIEQLEERAALYYPGMPKPKDQ